MNDPDFDPDFDPPRSRSSRTGRTNAIRLVLQLMGGASLYIFMGGVAAFSFTGSLGGIAVSFVFLIPGVLFFYLTTRLEG